MYVKEKGEACFGPLYLATEYSQTIKQATSKIKAVARESNCFCQQVSPMVYDYSISSESD